MTLSLLSQVSRSDFSNLTPLQSQMDGLVGGFVDQVTDWRSLAAMTAGGMAYRLGRVGALAAGTGRLASLGLGLGTEVTIFEMTSRSLTSLTGESSLNHNLWRWEGQGGIRQGLLSSLVTFGTLKGAGRLAQGENMMVQHLLQDTGMVLGHQISAAFGITPRPTGSLAEQFLHAEATNLQLGAGTALGHTLTGGRIQAMERGLDLASQITESPFWPITSNRSPSFAMATVEGGQGRGSIPGPEKGPPRLFMTSDGHGSRSVENGVASRLLREVLDRGRRNEVVGLKNILLQILSLQSQTRPRLYLERLSSQDSEDWKLGFRSLVHDSRMHQVLETDKAFGEFAQDWFGRPHFKDLLEIDLRFDPALKHTTTMRRDLRILQHGMVLDPSLLGFLNCLRENRVSPDEEKKDWYRQNSDRKQEHSILLRRISRDDGAHFIGNWKHAGIIISFDLRGYLRLPILVRSPYRPEAISAESPPIFVESVSLSSPARKSSSKTSPTPLKGDNPSVWSMRLLEGLREGKTTPLDIVTSLRQLILQDQWGQLVREGVERLSSLTSGTKEGEGLVVRLYSVPRLQSPLILFGFPGIPLPDENIQAYGREIAMGLPKDARKVDEILELGAGSGYVSFIFSKLGLAHRILAVDPSPLASIVGGLNAALNEVTNVAFREGRVLSDLPLGYKADLILAPDPSAFQAGRAYLRPDGRFGLKTVTENTP